MTLLATKKIQYTYTDYKKLPEGSLYQLVQGELIMAPSPSYEHQRVISKLGNMLFQFVEDHGLGEVLFSPMDVYLSETDVYQPDIIFVSAGHLNLNQDGKIKGPPELVMEVLSPSTAYYDLRTKRDIYEARGVKEYWIVDPIQKSIEIYENTDDGFQLFSKARGKGNVSSKLLQGLKVNIENIW